MNPYKTIMNFNNALRNKSNINILFTGENGGIIHGPKSVILNRVFFQDFKVGRSMHYQMKI